MDRNKPAVEMVNITKRFPGIVANDHISFKVNQGEIHALLGENGAGKSTLMNILFGLYQPDEGEIYVHGEKVVIDGPNKAIRLGIGMVHQHFKLVETFTVTENIILGQEPTKGLTLDYKTARAKVAELSRRYGLDVDPDAKIGEISVGMQQRVEILKILYRGAEILIFDEPTAVLTPQEIDELMAIMKNLVQEGKTILLITHKLREIMAISDAVTIIRRGKVIETLKTSETNPDMLAEMMVGRHVTFQVEKGPSKPGEVILRVEGIREESKVGKPRLNGISFQVRAGEIYGIAGVDGNGQSQLIEVITGLKKASHGKVLFKGREITNQPPRKISELGISHIPEDRQRRGLILDFTLSENLALKTYFRPAFQRRGFLHYEAMNRQAERLVEQFDVRTPSILNTARSLSGGNQQKAIIAREYDADPDLMIAAQPTRGLDVGAIEYIHKRLVELRDKGKAVLLISFELDEILQLSDRIGVIFNGQIVGEVRPEETDEQELGLMMAGSKVKEVKESHG
ncbi:guanosine ABC transporter (ATP-binding protein) [[Clostridium] ultunense Esp]|nr:guanosine ABC transporter (ATP-binding protein) [[Clostridium] ultunense Esp]